MLPFIFCQLSGHLAAAASPAAAGVFMTRHLPLAAWAGEGNSLQNSNGFEKEDRNKILNKFPFNLFDHSTLRDYELLKFDNKYSIQLIM